MIIFFNVYIYFVYGVGKEFIRADLNLFKLVLL